MTTHVDEKQSRAYYDEFSAGYERKRGRGYHALIDDLEVELATRHVGGARILEAGAGTGLVLQRLAPHARQAVGIDLSAGMLRLARERELSVAQASVEVLPFADETFDVVLSFKVLAHVPGIEAAVRELCRVTRKGGHLVLEFYNRHSLRTLIKRLKRPTTIGQTFSDEDVHTRFDSLADILRYLPPGVSLQAIRGVRVLTPVAQVHDLPVVSRLFAAAERLAADAPGLRRLGGFLIVVLRRDG
ncbi:MAG: class I SAM-dependent methyltransferase [Acidobacteriota bacterium]